MPETLSKHDLQWILRRTPTKVLALMKQNPGKLFMAGGFIRACISNEPVADIDLFVPSKEAAQEFAKELASKDDDQEKRGRIYETDNAITIKGYKYPLQIIHRWTYERPIDCLQSFDFTIGMGVVWWQAANTDPEFGSWESACHKDFYADLAGKRLVYTSPIRNEDAGGSMLRVLKFYQRGYRIPLSSLGAVVSRLLDGVHEDNTLFWHGHNLDGGVVSEPEVSQYRAKILTGLLREVDPNVDPSHIAHLPDVEEL